MASSFSDQVKKLENDLGYKGCRNCTHQIAPFRQCKWAEQGGDSHIHLLCPRWDRRDTE